MRTKKSIYNFLTDVFPYFFLGILSFVKIRFVINNYGSDVNGYMQLITQIFSYLALAEAGFGTAVIYKLYKPLADNDQNKISSIVKGSKVIFKRIALIMTICSLIISFLIPFFINKGSLTNSFIIIIFLLYVINYLAEYFIVYPFTSLLQADQNQYIFNLYRNIMKISFGILEIILMSFKVNLILIVLINILFTFAYIFFVLRKTRKIYPWLNNDVEPDTTAFKMTKDVIVHKISSLVFSKTDPILLSKFSLNYVTIYTSYNYILDFITTIISKLYNSLRASYCNIVVSKQDNTDKKYFNMFLAFSFFIASFCCVTFNRTINPFVEILWLGKDYVLKEKIVFFFTLIMLGRIIINPIYVARDSKGLYKESKWFTILQAIVNLVISIILVQKYKILGVLIGTVVSQIFILIPCNIYLVYQKVFHKGLSTFFKNCLLLIINVIVLYYIDNFIFSLFTLNSIFKLVIFMSLIAFINLVESFIVYYFFNQDFKMLMNELFSKLRRKFK